MQTKTVIGWGVLLFISIIPVFLWAYLGPGAAEFFDYSSITHSLGELFGLVGMTMFALTFVLSTRISFIEDIFGGLDKVYITHGIMGGTALILILAHPIFLVLKFIPSQIGLAATYLLPSSYWSVNFGIIALVGIMALIYITLFVKIKYNRWKYTHEFLGAMFFLAVLHIFMVRDTVSQDNIFAGYYVYAAIVSFIGLAAFSYSLFIKDRLFKNAVYTLKSLENQGNVFRITLEPEHKPISYKSGQFIYVRFYNENIPKEAHPFSIASKSNSDNILIVVKKLGDYTSKLEHLRKGDKVSVEGPYGRFNYKQYAKRDQIWIAAGIGVTPFLGMAQDIENDSDLEGKITLFYSVKDSADLIGYDTFKNISERTHKFKFIPWISSTQCRINAKTIYDLSGGFKGKEFFLCGPEAFKESIIPCLIEQGVPEDHIHEEVFNFI